MKDFKKAMKMYIRISYHPLMVILMLLIIGGISIAMMVDPAEISDKGYIEKISAVGMIHGMLLMLFFLGNSRMASSKCFSSLPQAKSLFTDVPIVAIGTLCIGTDIVIFTAALLMSGKDVAADFLIVDSINTVLVCFLNVMMYKYRGKAAALFMWLILFSEFEQIFWLGKISALKHGFGLGIPAAALIAVAIYVVGIAAIRILAQHWWKSSSRNFVQPIKNLS